jgi:hypothetical protein
MMWKYTKLVSYCPWTGVFHKTDENLMKITAQSKLADALKVSYIRVQDTRIDYDNSNVYISATLLDRAPAAGKPHIMFVSFKIQSFFS